MTYRVEFSQAAEDDVAELLAYLVAHAGEQVARSYVDRIIDHCQSFELFPERGLLVDTASGLRIVGYKRKASIAFQVKGDLVRILRIFHHGQNVDFADDPAAEDDAS